MAKLPARFRSKFVVDENGCWLWIAGQNKDGYGHFWYNNKQNLAHKVAYEILVGPVPEGKELDHLCRVRRCVRPSHCEPVTHAENLNRGERANRTHCPQGHPYDEKNTYRYGPNGTRRMCRTCVREKMRIHRAKKNPPKV